MDHHPVLAPPVRVGRLGRVDLPRPEINEGQAPHPCRRIVRQDEAVPTSADNRMDPEVVFGVGISSNGSRVGTPSKEPVCALRPRCAQGAVIQSDPSKIADEDEGLRGAHDSRMDAGCGQPRIETESGSKRAFRSHVEDRSAAAHPTAKVPFRRVVPVARDTTRRNGHFGGGCGARGQVKRRARNWVSAEATRAGSIVRPWS